MIRIGVDARPLAHPKTGIGRYTSELLLKLIGMTKNEIEWLLYADRPISFEFLDQSNVIVRQFDRWNPALSYWRTQIHFSWWARRDELDLFWSPRHHLPLFLPKEMKKIVTVHDLVWKRYPETMQTFNKWVDRLLMPPSVAIADKVLCDSTSTGTDLAYYFPQSKNKINTILLGKGEGCKLEASLNQGSYFLFVGTLEPRKNLNRILEAYQKFLEKECESYNLVVVGGAGWKQSIQETIDKLNISKNVDVIGQVDDSTLNQLYQNAKALILVSLYEGFGLPAVEAMQYGVPVIGSNISSIPEVVGEAGILVDPLSTNQIADAMLAIAQDQSLRNGLSELARIQAAKFSWDKTASETLAVFRELVS